MELVRCFHSSFNTHNSILLIGTGEHGIGIGKKDYLVKELGEGTVELMYTIKHAVDPLGLFNPGKVGRMHAFSDRARY